MVSEKFIELALSLITCGTVLIYLLGILKWAHLHSFQGKFVHNSI